MKKVLLTLLIVSTYSISLLAQENKQHEVGLIFNSFDSFGFAYRFGTERSLWRTSSLFLSGYNREDQADGAFIRQHGSGFNLRFGKEFRKELVEKLDLRYGVDLLFTFQKSDYEIDDKTASNYDRHTGSKTYSPGLGIIVGLNYHLGERFLIGAEVLPNVSYSTGSSFENYGGVETHYDLTGFSYGISSTSALLSVVYKF
jgi:hypothetical protein